VVGETDWADPDIPKAIRNKVINNLIDNIRLNYNFETNGVTVSKPFPYELKT